MQLKIYPENLNKNGITGWVLVEVKPQDERMDLYKKVNFKAEAGVVDIQDSQIDSAKALSKIVRESIIDCEILYDGVKHDKEALFFYEDLAEAITEIGTLCLKGPTLAKKL